MNVSLELPYARFYVQKAEDVLQTVKEKKKGDLICV